MRPKLFIVLLFLLTALSSVQADSKLVCNLFPRTDDGTLRHIWLLFTKKGQKDYNYISIEGRAYDRIPDWAKRIRSVIDSKAHKIITNIQDGVDLQIDVNKLYDWTTSNLMEFNTH